MMVFALSFTLFAFAVLDLLCIVLDSTTHLELWATFDSISQQDYSTASSTLVFKYML
jgi:hypothetical protein